MPHKSLGNRVVIFGLPNIGYPDFSLCGQNVVGKWLAFCCCFVLFMMLAVMNDVNADEVKHKFSVPVSQADIGLNLFAKQSDTPLLYSHDQVHMFQTNELEGHYTLEQALEILLKNSGLTGSINQSGVLTVTRVQKSVTQQKTISGGKIMEAKHQKRSVLASVFKTVTTAITGVLAIGAVSSSTALAQTKGVIEEVVVTATKRGAQNVQDIAGAINALTGDYLDEKGITDFEEFAGSIPGLQFQDLGPGDKEYIIRGINGTGPAVVGAYFDEYVITANDQQDGGGKNAPIKLIDLERVEVLNGPQGTLYGANSMAGNIKFIPRKPDTEAFDAFVDTDFSGTKEGGFNYTVSGAVNVPIIQDVLALRFTGWRTDNDGWIDQPRLQNGAASFTGNAEDVNDEETNGGRIMLRWTPNDRFTLDAMYLNQDLETGGSPRSTAEGSIAWPGIDPAIAATGIGGFAPLAGLATITTTEDFVNTDITVNTRDDEVELFGATASYQFDFGTATVSASHFNHDILFKFDSTPILLFFGAPVPGITVQPQSYETTMIEARFASELDGPFNFVGGFYYQKDENDFEVRVTTTDGQGNDVPWMPANANDAFIFGGTAIFGRQRNDEITQKAIFGEFTYDFMERWQFLVGLRAFETELESVQQTIHAFLAGADIPAGTRIGTNANGNGIGLVETNDNTIRPKVSLSFDLNEEVMLYGLYSEGFRVGGINNANQPFATGIPSTFSSDELTNLEFGIKSQFLEKRLQLNAAIFFVDWEDIQVESRDPTGNIPFISNGGEAEINGLEWAILWYMSDNLEFTFSGTHFFDSNLTTDQPALPGAPTINLGLDGDNIPNIPENEFYFSLKYDMEIAGMPLSLLGDVTYRGETNTEFRENSPFNIELDSYTILNLYANLEINENFSTGIYVKNATDELAVNDGIGTFQDPASIIAARPRTIGATIRWNY